MEIVGSLEVRWFLAARDPAASALRKAFARVRREAPRRDVYLVTGREDLAVKSRGGNGNLELKFRTDALGGVALMPRVAGAIERWTKLSVAVEGDRLRGEGTWIAVSKTRRQRKFVWRKGAVAEAGPDARPDAGCNVEWTELAIRGRAEQATLAFEAFGPEEDLLEVVLATARSVAGGWRHVRLPAASSRGYASWISALAR